MSPKANYSCEFVTDPLPESAKHVHPRRWAVLHDSLNQMLKPEWSENGRPWLNVKVADKRAATLARSSTLGWAARNKTEVETHYMPDDKGESYTLWARIANNQKAKPAKIPSQKDSD